MKKIVLAAIVCMSVILGGCKEKNVSTKYSIGNLESYSSSTDWATLENYLSSTVTYNKIVTFENTSLSLNDQEALQYYNDQLKKLDTTYICSLLKGPDYLVYGISTLNADGTYRRIGAIRFEKDGTSNAVQ